jgi:predicted Zn-dependent protease
MKAAAFVLSALIVASTAVPASAQIGGILRGANKAVDAKQKIDDLTFTEKEERQIGEQVSAQLRAKYGVYQDKEVTKYVTLVGSALAQASDRPNIEWNFIVLDTDGVNAFAVPGGIVHVTRGLLGLLKTEAELASVLGHELTHVTEKHAIAFLRQSKAVSIGTDVAGGGSARDYIIAKASERLGHFFLDNEFKRQDEDQSDETGLRLANKLGYAPTGLAEALKKIQARNSDRTEKNGLFASHPALKDRISNAEKLIAKEKLTATATGQARYAKTITFDAKGVGDITMNVDGASGLAAGDKKKEDDKKAEEKKDEPKKSRFGGLSSITGGGSKQAQSSQQVASAGARGGVPDRDAKGGSNPSIVAVKVTATEVEGFKKGIGA